MFYKRLCDGYIPLQMGIESGSKNWPEYNAEPEGRIYKTFANFPFFISHCLRESYETSIFIK